MPIKLDLRLKTIADLVDYGSVADIGCDHGKLGYYLIGSDRASKVIATDISSESLKKAEELAYSNGVNHLMETRLGDGITPIGDGEVDTVVIAGMGGDLISNILFGCKTQKKRYKNFVISPNTHPEQVRLMLHTLKQEIVYDDIVFVGGKYYTIIKSIQDKNCKITPEEINYGKFYKTSKSFRIVALEELRKFENIAKNVKDDKLNEKIEGLRKALKDNNVNIDEK